MKAVYFLGPKKLELREVPTPSPKRGEILVKIHACAVCGTDVRIYQFGQKNVVPPHIIGHEIAGEIAEVGKGVKGYREGERVVVVTSVGCRKCRFCWEGRVNLCRESRAFGYHYPGGFAEYILIPSEAVEGGNLLPFPPSLSWEGATLAEPLSCCINGQEYLKVEEGDTVVVIGTGPIGCMHLELARIKGSVRTIGVEIKEERIKLAQERIKADVWLNLRKENLEEKVLEFTQGEGAEVVIVACPSGKAQEEALRITAKRGRISFFGGLPHERSKISFDSNILHYREISVFGAFASSHLHYQKALALLSSGKIKGEKFITHTFPLERLEEAITTVREGKSLKAIIRME